MKAKLFTFVRGLMNGTPPRFQSYLKSLTLLLVMLMSVNVWGESVTFEWKTYTSSSSNVTEDPITFTGGKGTGSTPTRTWSDGLRIYAGGTAEFSAADGYVITNISGYEPFNFTSATGQKTVSFTNLSKATAGDVTVTYKSNAPAKPYIVTLSDDTSNPLEESAVGAGVTLPTRDDCEDYIFQGWSETNCDTETAEEPELVTIKDGKYYPSKDITLYPIYKKTVTETGSATSYKITYKKGTNDSGTTKAAIDNGSDYASLSTNSYAYQRTNGMHLSSGSNAGNATLTLTAAGKVNASSIVTNALAKSGKSFTINVTYTDATTKSETFTPGTTTKDNELELDDTKTISTIYYSASSGSGAGIASTTVNHTPSVTTITYYSNPSCAPKFKISSSLTGQGSILWSLDGEDFSSTIDDQIAGTSIFFKLQPNTGYVVSGTPTVSNVDASDIIEEDGIYGFDMPEDNVTVSATFVQPETYIILYEKGNWESAEGDVPDPDEVTPGTNYTVSTDELSLTGYTFKGWNTDKNASAGLTNITVNDDITLYAIFTINSYNITFNPSITGGSIKVNGSSISPVSVEYNSDVTITVTPTTHFNLSTLTYNSTDIKTAKSFKMPAENVEIAYSFTEDPKVTVTFKNNGETLTTDGTREVYVGDPIGTLPVLTSTDAKDARSKTFVGWTESEINVWQDAAPTLITASEVINGVKTYNAVWAKGDGKYQQITSESELIAGKKYIIQNDSKVIAHNSTPALIQNESALVEVDGKLTPEDRHLWTLTGSEDDGWSFVVDNTHKLSTQGTGTDLTLTGNNTLWTIWNIGETQSGNTPEYNTDDYFWIFQSDNSQDYYVEYSNSKWITFGIDNTKWPSTIQNGYFKIKLYAGTSLTDYITHSSSSPLASITLNTDEVKKNYFEGETFTPAGLTATATLGDNITFPIEFKDLKITEPSLASAGEKTVTVSYTFNGATKSATYDVNAYSVTVNMVYTDKVSTDDVTGNTYDWNEQTHALTFTKQDHYQFNGISNVVGATSSGSELNYTLSNPTANVTLTATWQRLFTLTYNGKGGSTPAAEVDKTKGFGITLATPSWTGYEFVGWYDNEGYEGEALTSPYSITADAEIFAKWSEIMPASILLSPDVTEITDLIYDDSNKKSKKITATVNPSTALTKTFTWSVVEGSDVVSVSSEGLITALKAGSAKVKVTSTRDVNVYKEIPVTVHALPQITWKNMDGTTYASTKGTSAGKVGTLPSGTPTSCDATTYPYFRGWSATPFGKTTTNPESGFVTVNTAVELDKEYTFYAVCAAGIDNSEEYSFTIQTSDFNTTSYAANNGSHDFTATATKDNSKTKTIACTTNAIMKNSNVMQWQSGNGYIYNTTDLGTIKSVVVSSSAGNFTTYYGTSEHPTSGTTIGNGYFTVKVGNATGKTSSVVVTFDAGSVNYTTWATQCTPTYSVNFYTTEETTNPYETQVIEKDQSPTKPTTDPSKVGCNFLGWSETWKGSVVDVTSFTIIEDKNFFAKWQYITPTITTHPQSNTGVKGANLADLTVVASADGATLSYQWQVSTTSSTEEFTNISGATSASYTPSTAEEGSFYYRCVVTNGEASATSNAATITVSPVTQCTTPTMIIGDGSTTYFIHSATVTLATQTEGATIYYTTDGTTASTTSTQYTDPFEISATTTVRAIAIKTNMTNSFEGSATFTKAALQSIEVETAPTKVAYNALENFAPAGLVITANYENNLSEDIAYNDHESDFTFEPDLTAQLHEANTSVQITWNGKSANQTITVTRVLTSISDATTTATFYEGGQVKASDFTCTYNYNDGDPVAAQAVEYVSLNGTEFATTIDIPLGQTGEKTVTVKKGDLTTTVNITINEKAKHTYIDRVHGNEDKVMIDSYTIPALSNADAATEGDCATTHYVFKGWVAEADADVPTDANLIAAGGSKTAEADATFYAVWAEHKLITKDLTMFYGWETSGSTSGWKSTATEVTKGYHSGSQSGKLSSSCTAIETTNKIEKPKSFTYYARKTSTNDKTAQYIVLQYSSSGSSFSDIDAGKVTNSTLQNDNNNWTKVTVDLSAETYKNQYFRIHKEGNAEQLIDDVTLVYEGDVEEDLDYITECVTRYELSFDANGGTGTAPDAIMLKEGGKVNLPNADGLSKAYNTFSGWNDGSKTMAAGDEYTMPNNDVNMKAQWTTCKVTELIITNPASNLEFGVGQTFSSEGLKVKAIYESTEVEADVTFTTDFDGHVFTEGEIGQQTITISYKEGTATYDVEIKAYLKAEFYVFGEHYYTYVCKDEAVKLDFPAIPTSNHLVYKNFVGWSADEFDAQEEEPTLVAEGADFSDGDKFYAVFGRASEYEEKTSVITRDKCDTEGLSGYNWTSWTVDGISGEIDLYAGNASNMQMKGNDGRYGAIFSNVATPGKILSISAKKASGTDREWNVYVNETPFTEDLDISGLTSLGAQTVSLETVTWNVTTETARFFLLRETTGGTNIDNFSITYIAPIIYSWTTNWVEPDHVRTGLTYDKAGTICLPYAVKADDYKGASIWSIESRTGSGDLITSITLVKEVDNEGHKKNLVAGKPYIFFAEESEFQLFYSGDEYTGSTSVWANGLIGNLNEQDIVINAGGYQPGSYLINQNKLMECGADCYVGQYRAYVKAAQIGAGEPLQAPVMAPRRVIGNPNVAPTRIDNLNEDAWVNMNGAHKFFLDGNIVILNEGQLYNAQGIRIQ